jgi:hypothetical protein
LARQNGELEIHVPKVFTPARPAVSFSRVDLKSPIEEHPLGKTFPKATRGPSIQAGPGDFRPFASQEAAPATLDDFVYNDIPQLSLHITSFTDATLVALSWPHTLMDVMGQHALLRAWSLVLAGREDKVPPVLGAREDAIFAAADEPGEVSGFELGRERLQGWAMLAFGLRFAWDMLWNQVVDTRTVYLPKAVVCELRREAEADLAAEDGGEGKPFVSEGDVLTAWATRAVALSQPQPRPMTVLHAVNARFRLPSLAQASGVYIQNMAVAAFAFLSPEVATGPLGQIALVNRRQLMRQTSEGQILACLRELRQQPKLESDPTMVCGPSDAVLMPFTNWGRANIFKTIDFSGAVVRAGETAETRSNPPGTIVFHHADSMRPNSASRNVVILWGKDHDDGQWLTGILLPPAWVKIEAELKRLQDRLSAATSVI